MYGQGEYDFPKAICGKHDQALCEVRFTSEENQKNPGRPYYYCPILDDDKRGQQYPNCGFRSWCDDTEQAKKWNKLKIADEFLGCEHVESKNDRRPKYDWSDAFGAKEPAKKKRRIEDDLTIEQNLEALGKNVATQGGKIYEIKRQVDSLDDKMDYVISLLTSVIQPSNSDASDDSSGDTQVLYSDSNKKINV